MIEKTMFYEKMASGRHHCALAKGENGFTFATGFGKTKEEACTNAEAALRRAHSRKKITKKRR